MRPKTSRILAVFLSLLFIGGQVVPAAQADEIMETLYGPQAETSAGGIVPEGAMVTVVNDESIDSYQVMNHTEPDGAIVIDEVQIDENDLKDQPNGIVENENSTEYFFKDGTSLIDYHENSDTETAPPDDNMEDGSIETLMDGDDALSSPMDSDQEEEDPVTASGSDDEVFGQTDEPVADEPSNGGELLEQFVQSGEPDEPEPVVEPTKEEDLANMLKRDIERELGIKISEISVRLPENAEEYLNIHITMENGAIYEVKLTLVGN